MFGIGHPKFHPNPFLPSSQHNYYVPIPGALPPSPHESYADTEMRIQAIITELSGKPKPNIKWHADFYGLPYTRLLARWNGRPSKMDLIPGNRKLNQEQDSALYSHLQRLDEIGISPLLTDIEKYANSILRQYHTGPTPAPTVGEGWARRWLERNPKFQKQRQSSIEVDRKIAQSPEMLRYWLEDKFNRVCRKYHIQPEDMWNGDESGFRAGIGKDQWVYTLDHDRLPTLSTANCRELITVIECISAAGNTIPPMIIVPGTIHLESWYAHTGMGEDFLIAVSESGYSNDELCLHWIKHVEKYTRATQKGEYRLLIIDGHASHCTREFIQYCDNHKIIPLRLPSHSTHLLQPLDVAVFQPYKHYHTKVIEEATRLGCPEFDKVEFLANITDIRNQALKPSTIRSSFRYTGLFPFDADLVVNKLRESLQRQRESTPVDQISATTDPDSIPLSTPSSVRRLKRYIVDVLDDPSLNDLPSPLKHKVQKIFKGAVIQATAGDLAREYLDSSTAAERARQLRHQPGRRQVQVGGVLYVSTARSMIKDRNDEEICKAKAVIARAEAKAQREKTAAWKLHLREIRRGPTKRWEKGCDHRKGFNHWLTWSSAKSRGHIECALNLQMPGRFVFLSRSTSTFGTHSFLMLNDFPETFSHWQVGRPGYEWTEMTDENWIGLRAGSYLGRGGETMSNRFIDNDEYARASIDLSSLLCWWPFVPGITALDLDPNELTEA